MCGVLGGISERNVTAIIVEGLSRLEYRGYDSTGIAIIDRQNKLIRKRMVGRVQQLKEFCTHNNLEGKIGIGHTRWATHGAVTEQNAHPHFSHQTIALVHNGIIENYMEIKAELLALGYKFESDTDSEVITHLIHYHWLESKDLLTAIKNARIKLHGAYALGVIDQTNPDYIVCVRSGSPLVLGIGINEMFFASDISALLPVTSKVIYLEDGDIAKLKINSYEIFDQEQRLVNRNFSTSEISAATVELGNYRHYMQKEIFEQPLAISNTIESFNGKFAASEFGIKAPIIFADITRVQIIACGTSYHAGLVAEYWIEQYANLPCEVDIASEFRYRSAPLSDKTLYISISQSGETADTIACLKYLQENNCKATLAICNVAESSLIRMSALGILTKAGPELGVASTKAFSTQLVVLLYLTFTLAQLKHQNQYNYPQIFSEIKKLPALVDKMFAFEGEIINIAQELEHKQHALFLGRNSIYPIAMEGALKIKEISYIHAESYASGELKHGPLAIIDQEMPIFVLMPTKILHSKVKSNLQEILARQALVYLFTDSDDPINTKCHKSINFMLYDVPEYLLAILYTIPMQLLAYHTAVKKGTDVDKPRNLAKSVTVE